MKKLVPSLMVISMLFSLAACSGGASSESTPSSADGSEVYELSMSGQDAEGLPPTDAMHYISEQVEQRTDGKVMIKLYPANQLGEARLQYEGVMDGSIDMLFGYLDPTYNSIFDATGVPYLTSNYDEAEYILSEDSNIYEMFKNGTAEIGMEFMGFFLNGVSGMVATKDFGDYLDPEAKKDTLIRIVNSPLFKVGVEALGYPVVSIPWADTYTSMQTGVMDGMTGVPAYSVNQNFGDIAKYYVATDMFLEPNVMVMSSVTVEKLPTEYVDVIREVCAEVTAESFKTAEKNINAAIEELDAKDVEILPITDDERRELAKKIREKIQPDLLEIFGKETLDLINEDIVNSSK